MTDVDDRERLAGSPAREVALDCVEAGIDAAHPETVLRESVSLDGDSLRVEDASYDLTGYDEVVVVGGGKAGGGVAATLERLLGDRLDGGVIVTDDPVETERIDVVEATHPVPNEAGVEGARRVRELVERAGERTLVLAVITGGGSALLPAPVDGITLADLQATTDLLLESGASIDEINAVRKHCSATKGGRLAAAARPATVVTLAFSDVVGDDLGVIASGPTVPDPTTYADALAVLDRYDLDVPETVRDHLEAGATAASGTGGGPSETPGPDADFDHVSTHVLANAWTAVDAAREVARERGYDPLVLSTRVRGEAREQGVAHVAVAEEAAASGEPVEPPAVVLSGGETTVTVRGGGEGGPNQEFTLRAALAFGGAGASGGAGDAGDVVLAAVDTDGRDGGSDAAGAVVDGSTVPDADAATDARAALADNDAGTFLDGRNGLIHTGRTGTNVNDLRVLVVER